MGFAKSKMMEIEERGYGESDKLVCSGCVKDSYLVKIIRDKGTEGSCSFCKDEAGRPIRHRKVYPLEALMEDVMPAIRYYYMDAYDNIPYDKETDSYLGNVIDHYDFVHEILAEEMQIEDMNLLRELFDIIEPKDRVSVYEYDDRTSKKDLRAWAKYESLINRRKELSVEQIVSLCTEPGAPADLKEIHEVLQEVMYHAREMHAYSSLNTGTGIYRCVNFHPQGYVVPGYESIPASLIGTAPSKYAECGRFSEKGDMMFYGASNPKTATIEVERIPGFPYTIGEFYTNKRIRLLNLCELQGWKRPSAFSLEQEDIDKRENWIFLREYINRISRPVIDAKNAEPLYKPLQVFTKYMQRVSGLHGIEYRSSKSKHNSWYGDHVRDRCYVLFAENRDCLDEKDRKRKLNTDRLQLFMKRYWQEEPADGTGDI